MPLDDLLDLGALLGRGRPAGQQVGGVAGHRDGDGDQQHADEDRRDRVPERLARELGEPDAGGGEERATDPVDGGGHVGERPLGDEHEALVLRVALDDAARDADREQLGDDGDGVAADRPRRLAADEPPVEQPARQRRGRVGVVDALRRQVGHHDARARALAQDVRAALHREEQVGPAVGVRVVLGLAQRRHERLLELRHVGVGRGLQVVDALGLQPLLQRRQQRAGRDRQRERACRHEGDQQAPAQARAPEELSHCSRKR
jgi:hypothetical protein